MGIEHQVRPRTNKTTQRTNQMDIMQCPINAGEREREREKEYERMGDSGNQIKPCCECLSLYCSFKVCVCALAWVLHGPVCSLVHHCQTDWITKRSRCTWMILIMSHPLQMQWQLERQTTSNTNCVRSRCIIWNKMGRTNVQEHSLGNQAQLNNDQNDLVQVLITP